MQQFPISGVTLTVTLGTLLCFAFSWGSKLPEPSSGFGDVELGLV